MAVQIPTLKVQQPTAPQSVGRMAVQGPDFSAATAAQGKATEKIIGAGVDLYQKFEDDAAKMESTRAHYQASSSFRSDLEKGKQIEGDPSAYYAGLRQKWNEDEERILENYQDASDYSKNFIRQRLEQARNEAESQANVNESIQRAKYDDRLTQDSRSLFGENAVMESRNFVMTRDKDGKPVADEQSWMGVHNQILEAKRVTEENLERKGLVVLDEETGRKRYSDIARFEMKKASSEVLSKIVKTYQLAGETDKAQWVMDNYSNDILSNDVTKLSKRQDESVVKNQALSIVSKVRRQLSNPDDQLAEIEEIKDPAVKSYAMKEWSSQNTIAKNTKKQVATEVRDDIMKIVMEGQRNGSIQTVQQIWENPRIKGNDRLEDLGAKDRKAIEQMLVPPKVSDDGKLAMVYEKIRQGQYDQNTSATEFLTDLEGIGSKDRTPLMTYYRNLVNQTDSERNNVFAKMTTELKNQAIVTGLIKKQPFGSELSPGDTKKLNEMRNELIDELKNADLTKLGSIDKQNEYLRRWVTSKKTGEAFTGLANSSRPVFNPPVAPAPRGTPAAGASSQPLTKPQPTTKSARDMALDLWKDTYKTDWPRKGVQDTAKSTLGNFVGSGTGQELQDLYRKKNSP